MHPDQINQYKKARPFQPFRLVLDGGKTFDVRDPLHILVTPTHVFVGVGEGQEGLPLDLDVITPEMVARIELLPALGKAS